MCILCVVQRWSRRVANMLPWLVIPLIVLWALSQLLPPGLRFEITSPRIACVLVLLASLFWYEILLPQISAWQERRSARLRESKRMAALEMHKLRKTATRRCRNCQTPYRDQNPGGGGRFMCSYCGHVSKRPALDIPGPVRRAGLIGKLVGRNSWSGSQDWLLEGNGSWAGPAQQYSISWCSTEESFSGMLLFARRMFSSFFFGGRWLWSKLLRVCSSSQHGSLDAEHGTLSSRRGENGESFQESRVEKTRKKAEERRKARLEKEMLEEQERKQREEVARLVEERRKLRDVILEAEKEHSNGSTIAGERGSQKEVDKRRQERRKEKDKGSSKSSSDGEEIGKGTERDNERKHAFEKKTEHERHDSQKTITDNHEFYNSGFGNGNKWTASKDRYSDRMEGTFVSSSRGFNGASIFRRSTHNTAPLSTKASKHAIGVVDNGRSGSIRDTHLAGPLTGRPTQNGDLQTAGSGVQPRTTLEKPWHQLFNRSPSVSSYPYTNTTSFPSHSTQLGNQNAQPIDQKVFQNCSFDNQPESGGSPLSNVHTFPNGLYNSTSAAGSAISVVTKSGQEFIPEQAELFEDPCYVPNPMLFGPVSEPFDSFPLDIGAGIVTNNMIEGPCITKKESAFADVSKPSPIEPPMSRSRNVEEKHTASSQPICTQSQKAHDSNLLHSSYVHEQGTWQMWGSPLAKDGLDLISGPSGWFSPLGQKKFIEEDAARPFYHNPMISQITRDKDAHPAICTPQNFDISNHQNDWTSKPPHCSLNGSDLCNKNTPVKSLSFDGESHLLPLNLMDNFYRGEVTPGNSDSSVSSNSLEVSPANCWSKFSQQLWSLLEQHTGLKLLLAKVDDIFYFLLVCRNRSPNWFGILSAILSSILWVIWKMRCTTTDSSTPKDPSRLSKQGELDNA